MGYFDDIVPPDSASSYFPTPPGVPRITVRPKGVEPPPGPGSAQTAADASDGTDNSPPARGGGLFDDIVPPRPGRASRTPANASDETDNAPPARTGLFDDIVPPAWQPRVRPLATPVRLVQAPSVAFGDNDEIVERPDQ